MVGHFRSAIMLWVGATALVGYFMGPFAAFQLSLLAVLEVSFSFDNAIVNAKTLETMQPVWQQRFLTWGILIDVFFMRFLFPVLVVSVAAKVWPWDAITMAFTNPVLYAATMTSAHYLVAGFGMGFLLTIALGFFLDHEKDVHWLSVIEPLLAKLGITRIISVLLSLASVVGIATFLPTGQTEGFLIAGLIGVVSHEVTSWLGSNFDVDDSVGTVVKTGLAGFLYLEVQDASFSFDGVIGAFAITNSVILVALGLGIGALTIRSLTLLFVEKGILTQYRYLEHGAFWAIGILAVLMGVSTFREIPETVTGLIGAVLIGAAFVHSVIYNKLNPATIVDEHIANAGSIV